MRKNKLALLSAFAAVAAFGSQAAMAAGESTFATQAGTAIAGTQADMTLVWGGVLTMVIVIWGIYKIVKIFGGK